MAGLEHGPAHPQPFSAPMSLVPNFDVIVLLPPGAADRLRALRQRFNDLNALIPKSEDIREASDSRTLADNRLKQLLAHQQDGGFNLPETDSRVIEQQRLVGNSTDDLKRLKELTETRSPPWRAASHVLTAVESLLRDGKPRGTTLQDFARPEPKLLKGESVLDVIERLRRRVRELKADLHRIESAPYPSSYVKVQMRAQIEALAQQGAPVVSDLVERDRKIVWPTINVQSSVYNTGTPAIAFAEVPDTLALLAWLHRDALIVRLDAEIDAEADDAAALTHEQRQQREAEAQGDLLAVERDEAALVWRGQSEGIPVEHRADINPVALLGVRLVTAPVVS